MVVKVCSGCVFQLAEELSGVVEILGMVSNKGAIMASTYSILREDRGPAFGRPYPQVHTDDGESSSHSCCSGLRRFRAVQ